MPRFALGTLISIGVVINVANVAGRYLFNAPIIWAEEILVFIMIGCVFLGAILVTWEGQHIRMDLFSTRVGRPWRRIILALGFLAGLAMGGVAIFVVEASDRSLTSPEGAENYLGLPVVGTVPRIQEMQAHR